MFRIHRVAFTAHTMIGIEWKASRDQDSIGGATKIPFPATSSRTKHYSIMLFAPPARAPITISREIGMNRFPQLGDVEIALRLKYKC